MARKIIISDLSEHQWVYTFAPVINKKPINTFISLALFSLIVPVTERCEHNYTVHLTKLPVYATLNNFQHKLKHTRETRHKRFFTVCRILNFILLQ